MPVAVQLIWAMLLLAVLALLPPIVIGLHRIWRASRGIDRYFGEMLVAARGIAGHTEQIGALDQTIEAATGLLTTAGSIHGKAQTIKETLAARAGGSESR